MKRLHRTLLEEYLHIQGRNMFYATMEEMQGDREDYLVRYNTQRLHQSLNMKGRTPRQTLRGGLPKDSKGGIQKAA